mmetsp:Transcript_53828/g.166794  ORF Transcript_53828/g.166794 Transcript_53828/m.166794 type:complete len:408 (-) Transcript_53828:109-1332(-)
MPPALASLLLLAALLLALPGPASSARSLSAELIKARRDAAHRNANSTECKMRVLEATEEEEFLMGITKCNGAEVVEKAKKVERNGTASTLVSEESPLANESAGALLDLQEARFKDHSCTLPEFKEFKRVYGLRTSTMHTSSFGWREPCKQNNVVWFYPSQDHNGAFSINSNVCHRLMLWRGVACSVQVRRVGSAQEAADYLRTLPRDSVRHAVLGGHGSGVSLAWGRGSGLVGTEVTRGWFVPVGRVVRFRKSFWTISSVAKLISAGATGFVSNVDKAGDAYVYFDQPDYGQQWVPRSTFMGGTETVASPMSLLLQELGPVLQQHGSIFLDSCRSATSAYRPNLARYVASNACPSAHGRNSTANFIPYCAEEWADERCRCSLALRSGSLAAWRLSLAIGLLLTALRG